MKPTIVLVVTDQEKNAAIAKHKPGMLELRVDLFKKRDSAYVLKQVALRRKLKIPLLLTVRNQAQEGGVNKISDKVKLELIQTALPKVDWVDIELSSPLCAKVVALARSSNKKVVVSTHNFAEIPNDMDSLYKKCLILKADVVKIAVNAKRFEDLNRMVDFTLRHAQQPIVTMCVGIWGGLSRLVLPSVGSRWVYAFLHRPTAPGQLQIEAINAHFNA